MNDGTTTEKKITRKGAGRTKGSFSFVKVKGKDLLKLIDAMPELEFLIYRKQMESLGFTGLVTGKASELTESIAGQSVETAPEVISEDF